MNIFDATNRLHGVVYLCTCVCVVCIDILYTLVSTCTMNYGLSVAILITNNAIMYYVFVYEN